MTLLERTATLDVVLLGKDHLDAAAQCVFFQFYSDEPLVKTLAPPPMAFLRFTRQLVASTIDNGLAIGAIDRSNGELAGLALSDDYADEVELSESGCVAPIGAFLSRMKAEYRARRPFGRGEVLHLHMGAAWPSYRGQGFSTTVFPWIVRVGLERGFRYAALECASAATQKLARKVREPLFEMKYADFEFEGRKPFESLQKPESCLFYDALLDNPFLPVP